MTNLYKEVIGIKLITRITNPKFRVLLTGLHRSSTVHYGTFRPTVLRPARQCLDVGDYFVLCECFLALWYVIPHCFTFHCHLLYLPTGYDQGIMGSIISTPYFLEAINLKVGTTSLHHKSLELT
jgi:hypothetical protein